MDEAELKRRQGLTFEQAEGLEALPTQLALGQLSPILRARLWAVVYQYLEGWEDGGWLLEKGGEVMRRFCVERLAMMADEVRAEFHWNVAVAKRQFDNEKSYHTTLGFVQWFARAAAHKPTSEKLANVLISEHAAYRLVEGNTVVPIASTEEGEAYSDAIRQLAEKSLTGPKRHLTEAAGHLTEGQYAASVRESIHTIESILRLKDRKLTFAEALKEHSAQIDMHGAFRTALVNLYGYASDEEGIRHSLLEQGAAKVTERDAIFMLGVCASFATYLTSIPEDR